MNKKLIAILLLYAPIALYAMDDEKPNDQESKTNLSTSLEWFKGLLPSDVTDEMHARFQSSQRDLTELRSSFSHGAQTVYSFFLEEDENDESQSDDEHATSVPIVYDESIDSLEQQLVQQHNLIRFLLKEIIDLKSNHKILQETVDGLVARSLQNDDSQ